MNSSDAERRWSGVDRFAYRWAGFVVEHRWATIAVALLVAFAFASGLTRLEVSNNYRVFFGDQNPDLLAFEAFEATYTKNDNFLFVFKPKTGTIDQPFVAKAVEAFTDRAWRIPYASRVDSFTNFQHTRAEGDDLVVEDLIEGADEMSPREVAARVDVALAEPRLVGRLVARDRGATGVNVTLQFPEKSLAEVPEAIGYARDLVAEFEAAYPDLTIVISGVSALNAAFAEATVADGVLFPLMLAVLALVTWLIVRSLAGTLATVLVIALATLTAMGFAGWAGITISPFSGSAPVVILTLAIADSIHLLVTVAQRMRAGDGKVEALKESVRVNFVAVGVTSLTTVIGFLALNFSDAPPFRALGNISAVGIAAAWFFSLTFFPALLAVLPFKVKAAGGGRVGPLQRWIERLAGWVIAHARIVLVGAAASTLGLGAAALTLDLDDQFIEYFDHRIAFRGDAEFALENLTGLYVVEYEVSAGGPGAVNEPAYLDDLDAFTAWLRARPDVRHVDAYSDTIKRLNMNMHGDDPGMYRIPGNRELAAQYLLLYELSLPLGLDLTDRIDVDKSATRVTVTLDDVSTRETRAFLDAANAWWETRAPKTAQHATGASYLFAFISERNIRDMITGNVMAVVLIALVMMVALRSVALGALSLVPNVVPLIMTFGVWALLVGEAGTAAATVSATSLGIIVDNTVHLLTKYRRARTETGLSAPDAVRYAFRTVGAAVAANALILALGFGVLALSAFKITAEMGTLTALAILIALVVDFLLFPALLLAGAKPEPEGRSHASIDPQAV